MGNGCVNSSICCGFGGLIGIFIPLLFLLKTAMNSPEALGWLLIFVAPIVTLVGSIVGGSIVRASVENIWSPQSNAKNPATPTSLICNKCNHTNPKSWECLYCTNCGNSLKNARAYSNSKYNYKNTIIQCLTFILITIVVATILLYFYQFIPE